MNNVRHLLFFAAMLLLVGCSKDVNVKLSENSHEFEATGGSAEILLESNGAWQVGTCPDWISVSPMSGEGNSTLAMTCQSNMTGQDRSAEIKVSTKNDEAILAVKQSFADEDFITFSPSTINCDFLGGEFPIAVEANCNWSIAPLPSWIQCEPMSGSHSANVVLTIGCNDSSSEGNRDYDVDFIAGEQHFYLHISQENNQAYQVVPTPGSITFDSEGGTQSVALQCTVAWTLECDADWLSVTPTSGDGNGEISVTAMPNSNYSTRNARIMFTSSVGCTSAVRVSQEATPNPHYLIVNPNELLFPNTESSLDLTISTDSLWTVSCNQSWISISESNGMGDAVLSVTAEEYTLLGNRRAVIEVVSGSLRQTVAVTQASGSTEPVLSFSIDHLQFDSEHTVTSVSIYANSSWTIRMSEDWAAPITTMGIGDSDIEVEVKDNFLTEPRSTMLFLCYNNVVYDTLTIEQEGRVYHLESSVTELNASPQGDSFLVSVTANQDWKVTCNANWLHLDPADGIGDGEFRVYVDANNTPATRTAEIRLVGGTTGVVSIYVTQSSR